MRAFFLVSIILLLSAAPAEAQVTGQVVVNAEFASRTSLQVSSRVLRFDVVDPGQPALAEVEYSAAARTTSGGEVMLSVEPERAIGGPGGAADVETSLTFEAQGASAVTGTLQPSRPSVAGRWVGSGRRTGRVVFALRASAPGTYVLPVRFVVSTP